MKWRHDQCKDVIENSKDSIHIIWLTLILSIRLSLFQKKKRKEKNRCGVSVYSNRPWLMTLVQPPFFTLICQRLDKVFLRLRYFVNCFLASKPSNSFQRKRWEMWLYILRLVYLMMHSYDLYHITFSNPTVIVLYKFNIQDSNIVYSMNI